MTTADTNDADTNDPDTKDADTKDAGTNNADTNDTVAEKLGFVNFALPNVNISLAGATLTIAALLFV